MSAQPRPRLERPEERVIAGVCHGLGDYFEVDPVVVRIVFVVLAAAGGAGILAYLVLWVIMPAAGAEDAAGAAGVGEGIRTMATEMKGFGRDFSASMAGSNPPPPPPFPPNTGTPSVTSTSAYGRTHRHDRGLPVLGLGLVVLGVWLRLGNLGVLDWASARYVWPIALVALGLALVVRRLR
jgi:phage shock protein C